jgi:hypothetical protein
MYKRGKWKLMANKKAQFYLMAAIIIIGIIILLSTITNYVVTRKEPVKIYDLGEEFKEEGARVVDYGIYHDSPLETRTPVKLISNLSEYFATYSEEKDPGAELVFVYGNSTNMTTITYTSVPTGEVKLFVGTTDVNIEGDLTKKKEEKNFVWDTSNVEVKLLEQEYDFKLHEGENFFFVISKNSTETGEIYIAEKSD